MEQHRAQGVTSFKRRKFASNGVLHGYQILKGIKILLIHQATSQGTCIFDKPKEFLHERWLGSSRCPHCNPFAYNANWLWKMCIYWIRNGRNTVIVRCIASSTPNVDTKFFRSFVGDYSIKTTDINQHKKKNFYKHCLFVVLL